MRNKRLLRTLSALCLTLVLASGFTVPAFAQGAAPPPAEDTTNDSNVVVEETEKVRLYHNSLFSPTSFCTPDREDSTAKGTKILQIGRAHV